MARRGPKATKRQLDYLEALATKLASQKDALADSNAEIIKFLADADWDVVSSMWQVQTKAEASRLIGEAKTLVEEIENETETPSTPPYTQEEDYQHNPIVRDRNQYGQPYPEGDMSDASQWAKYFRATGR